MRDRVLIRYLVAREQLAPSVDHIEKLVKAEKWPEARDATHTLAKTLGVFFSGSDGVRISTGWWGTLDREDAERLHDWIRSLHNVYEVAYDLAMGRAHTFEGMWMDRMFDSLRRDLSWLQETMRDESDAFKHGRFDIIPMKGVTDPAEAVKTLDEAAAHVQGKFPQVLYGTVYVRKDLRPKGSFDPRPGSGGMIAGSYQAAGDTMTLSMYATPERNSMMTLIHEFGHRYHTRFLKGDKREKFMELYTRGDVQEAHFRLDEREKFADEWLARSKGFRDDDSFGSDGPVHLSERAEQFFNAFPRDEFKAKVIPLLHKFNEDKDDSVIPALKDALARSQFGGNLGVIQDEENLAPVYASPYGETSWEENFAESFLAFCLNKMLPKPLQNFMESL
jgi:hypothetical protein